MNEFKECPCYIDRPLHRYDKACLVQSQNFSDQQTEEKPILKCDEIINCPIKQLKTELHFKVEFIQEQREIIDLQAEEIRIYKQCQGKRASKREEELKQELDLYKIWYKAKHGDLKNYLGELKQENETLKQQVNDFISQYKLAHNRYMKYQTKLKRIEDRVQDIKFDDEHNIEIMNDILQIIKEE